MEGVDANIFELSVFIRVHPWPTFFRSRSRKTSVCAAPRIAPQRTGSVRFVFAKFVRGATEVLPLQLRLASIPIFLSSTSFVLFVAQNFMETFGRQLGGVGRPAPSAHFAIKILGTDARLRLCRRASRRQTACCSSRRQRPS